MMVYSLFGSWHPGGPRACGGAPRERPSEAFGCSFDAGPARALRGNLTQVLRNADRSQLAGNLNYFRY